MSAIVGAQLSCAQLVMSAIIGAQLSGVQLSVHASFMPAQLYHDIQRMIQGCYFASTLLQVRGGGSMYLYQLGT